MVNALRLNWSLWQGLHWVLQSTVLIAKKIVKHAAFQAKKDSEAKVV